MAQSERIEPQYATAGLGLVLPAAAARLGVTGAADVLGWGTLHTSPRAVVVALIDGLGRNLLTERAGHAPYLRSLQRRGDASVVGELTVGFPTTTATSLASFGTGAPPGRHGVVGYDVLDTARDRIVNQLTWPDDLDPVTWQPLPTVFERAAADGVAVVRVGPKAFAASGLTRAALRGGRYVVAKTLQDRVNATLREVRGADRVLAYLYWEGLDRVGHDKGCESAEWTAQLEDVDAALARLAAGLPAGALLAVTGDHGMLDISLSARIDLAARPDLRAGVRISGGEPRAVYLWPERGRRQEVVNRWRDALGEAFDLITREDAVAAGWFGAAPIGAHLERAGEVIALARQATIIVDSSRQRTEVKTLIGWHGGLSPDEALVPLLVDAR